MPVLRLSNTGDLEEYSTLTGSMTHGLVQCGHLANPALVEKLRVDISSMIEELLCTYTTFSTISEGSFTLSLALMLGITDVPNMTPVLQMTSAQFCNTQ